MIEVVVDTNVIVSALISSRGNEALVLAAINQGLLTPLFSLEILAEYREVLLRPKFSFPSLEVEALMDLLGRCGKIVATSGIRHVSSDPEDDKFIACALTGRAQFLVTGNKKHFPSNRMSGVKVVNAGELLEFITLEL